MAEGEMGRVCPPVILSIVMVVVLLVMRNGSWLPSGKGDGEAKGMGGEECVGKDIWFHAGVHVTRRPRRKVVFK